MGRVILALALPLGSSEALASAWLSSLAALEMALELERNDSRH